MELRFFASVAALVSVASLAFAVGCSSATTPSTPAPAPSTTSTAPVEPPPSDEGTPKPTPYTEAEVQKLFDARCVRCHDARSANLDLSEPFVETTVGVKKGGASGATKCGQHSAYGMLIAPGDRAASLLFHKVAGTQDCGEPMPYDRDGKKLDATELERLGLYIDGLPKN